MVNPVKKAVKKGIDVGVYSLLTEKQRKAIGDALPEKQKDASKTHQWWKAFR